MRAFKVVRETQRSTVTSGWMKWSKSTLSRSKRPNSMWLSTAWGATPWSFNWDKWAEKGDGCGSFPGHQKLCPVQSGGGSNSFLCLNMDLGYNYFVARFKSLIKQCWQLMAEFPWLFSGSQPPSPVRLPAPAPAYTYLLHSSHHNTRELIPWQTLHFKRCSQEFETNSNNTVYFKCWSDYIYRYKDFLWPPSFLAKTRSRSGIKQLKRRYSTGYQDIRFCRKWHTWSDLLMYTISNKVLECGMSNVWSLSFFKNIILVERTQ